jgi:hypothetical protein
MAMSDHDLNEQDKEVLIKFLEYLSKETSWRYALRQLNRLETITLWENLPKGSMLGVSIGAVMYVLKLPLEELVNKSLTSYSKGWEMQVMYYRFKEGE